MNRAAEPYRKVVEIVNGFEAARILHVAVALGVFERLADEGKTASQLAAVLHLDARALELLLNALAGMGFVHKEMDRFVATPMSRTYLVEGGPKYLGHLVAHTARRWNSWGHLMDAVRSGKPLRRSQAPPQDPHEIEDCVRGAHELALAAGDARALARAIPLRNCRKLLELGAGPGTCAVLFCRTYRDLQATIMVQPERLAITRRILEEFDRRVRITTLAGDYRVDPITGGPYDVALLSDVLHREDEETNAQLLRKVHASLAPGGILIVKDPVLVADRTRPEPSAVLALDLLLETRGRTYSYAEIAAWMQAAGFRDVTELPAEPPLTSSLVLALRPGKRAIAILPRPAAKVMLERSAGASREIAPAGRGLDDVPPLSIDPRRAPRPPVASPHQAVRPENPPAARPAKPAARAPASPARKHTAKRTRR